MRKLECWVWLIHLLNLKKKKKVLSSVLLVQVYSELRWRLVVVVNTSSHLGSGGWAGHPLALWFSWVLLEVSACTSRGRDRDRDRAAPLSWHLASPALSLWESRGSCVKTKDFLQLGICRAFLTNVSLCEERGFFYNFCIDSGFIASLWRSWIVFCCTKYEWLLLLIMTAEHINHAAWKIRMCYFLFIYFLPVILRKKKCSLRFSIPYFKSRWNSVFWQCVRGSSCTLGGLRNVPLSFPSDGKLYESCSLNECLVFTWPFSPSYAFEHVWWAIHHCVLGLYTYRWFLVCIGDVALSKVENWILLHI